MKLRYPKVEAAENECTEGLPDQLERLESALAAFESAGGYTVQVSASSWRELSAWHGGMRSSPPLHADASRSPPP